MTAFRVFGVLLPYTALVLTAWAAWASDQAHSWGPALFVASVVLFGLPHGAVDHVVMARLAGVSVASKRAVGLVTLYLGVVLAVIALWLVAPAVVWVGFIGTTWLHWGQGDAWFLGRPGRPALIASRGALPMLAPLVFHPDEYLRVSAAFVEASGHTFTSFPTPPTLQLGALVLLAAAVASEVREAGRPSVEPALLLAFFAVVPPVLAIAIYFCFWHAPRHLVRLSQELRGPRWRDLAWVLRKAVPLTVAAASLTLLVFALLPTHDYFSVYLAVIASLTLPHVMVVCCQDVRSMRSAL